VSKLTPELRGEIERLLGASTIRHGQAFRGMEARLTPEKMAADWGGKTVPYVKTVMRSVHYMLDGELPGGKAMAYENSFGYRELWELGPSPELLTYVRSCLTQLKTINPAVKLEPMGQVSFPDGPVRRKSERSVSYCSSCFLPRPRDCD